MIDHSHWESCEYRACLEMALSANVAAVNELVLGPLTLEEQANIRDMVQRLYRPHYMVVR